MYIPFEALAKLRRRLSFGLENCRGRDGRFSLEKIGGADMKVMIHHVVGTGASAEDEARVAVREPMHLHSVDPQAETTAATTQAALRHGGQSSSPLWRWTLGIIALALFAAMGYLLGAMIQELHLQIPPWILQMFHR
jgi:anti-sigma-K factor RskA